MRRTIWILALLLTAASASAAPPHGRGALGGGPLHGPGRPPFAEFVFPPELVLNHQLAIGLDERQIASIKKLIAESHARTIDLQVDLQRAGERLQGILATAQVDESEALGAAEQAMGLESQIKRAHLTLLIRVKNLLTAEQQAKLDGLRPRRAGDGPDPD